MEKRSWLHSWHINKKNDLFHPVRLYWISLFFAIFMIPVSGCQKNEVGKMLLESGIYRGTFESTDNIGFSQDSVYLTIFNGRYSCSTNLPFNYGAGTIEIYESTVDFIDTLFFPIPALYITGFALSGEYKYQYDGLNLTLKRLTNPGNLTYKLKKRRIITRHSKIK